MNQINCPNCAGLIEKRLQASKISVCEYCHSTIVYNDDGFKSLGKQGVQLSTSPILTIGEKYSIASRQFIPLGMACFDYGLGTWDEFWCMSLSDENESYYWISFDEGDIAIEEPLSISDIPASFKLGTKSFNFDYQTYHLGETETAKCVAIRGELPELIDIGETHRFYDYFTENGSIITIETWQSDPSKLKELEKKGILNNHSTSIFKGSWIDPFENFPQLIR